MKRHMMYLGAALAALALSSAALAGTTQDYLQQKQTNQQMVLSATNSANQGSQSIDTSLNAVSGFTTITQPINLALYGLPGIQDSSGQTTLPITVGTGTSVGQQLMSSAYGNKGGACLMGDTRYGPPYYGGHVGSNYCYGGSSHWEFGEARVYPRSDGSARLDILFNYRWRTLYFPMDKPYSYTYYRGSRAVRFKYSGLLNGTMQLQAGTYGYHGNWSSGSYGWGFTTMATTNFQQAQTDYGRYWHYATRSNCPTYQNCQYLTSELTSR